MSGAADETMPILGVRRGDVPERVVVVGDPVRAERTAKRLADARELSRSREYVTFAGDHDGQRVGVVSHGVGSAGAAICFEELCRCGVRRIVRAGTAGSLQTGLADGSLVIARGAVRDEGVTPRLVPAAFPALAGVDVVIALRGAAIRRSATATEGIVLTSDVFYPHRVLGSDLARWQRAGVAAVEMECAALFVIAALYGIEAGAVLTIDGYPLADENMSGYDPHRDVVDRGIDVMLDVALDAVAAPL